MKPQTHPRPGQILADRRVLLFAFIYFGSSASSYGLSIWTPQIIKEYGLTNFQTGLLEQHAVWAGVRGDGAVGAA